MNKSEDRTPDFGRALRGAVKVARYLSESDALDEETLTGSVLGALCASMGYEAELATPKYRHVKAKFSWARYNKGTATNPHSEAHNGADFALVFVDDKGKSRIAVFQAKRGKITAPVREGDVWTLETFHKTKNKLGKLVPQMEPLTRATQAIQLANKAARPLTPTMVHEFYKSPPTVVGLHWVHYLAYVTGIPRCFPLSAMGELLTESRKRGATTATFNFKLDDGEAKMFDVLEDGLKPTPKHWLPLKDEEAIKAIPTLIDMMPVYFSGHLDKLKIRLSQVFSNDLDIGSSPHP